MTEYYKDILALLDRNDYIVRASIIKNICRINIPASLHSDGYSIDLQISQPKNYVVIDTKCYNSDMSKTKIGEQLKCPRYVGKTLIIMCIYRICQNILYNPAIIYYQKGEIQVSDDSFFQSLPITLKNIEKGKSDKLFDLSLTSYFQTTFDPILCPQIIQEAKQYGIYDGYQIISALFVNKEKNI